MGLQFLKILSRLTRNYKLNLRLNLKIPEHKISYLSFCNAILLVYSATKRILSDKFLDLGITFFQNYTYAYHTCTIFTRTRIINAHFVHQCWACAFKEHSTLSLRIPSVRVCLAWAYEKIHINHMPYTYILSNEHRHTKCMLRCKNKLTCTYAYISVRSIPRL